MTSICKMRLWVPSLQPLRNELRIPCPITSDQPPLYPDWKVGQRHSHFFQALEKLNELWKLLLFLQRCKIAMKIYLRGTILYQNKTKQNTKQKTNTDLWTVLISWMSARMYLSIEDMVFLQVFFFFSYSIFNRKTNRCLSGQIETLSRKWIQKNQTNLQGS